MRNGHNAVIVPKVMTKVSPEFKAVLEDLPHTAQLSQ